VRKKKGGIQQLGKSLTSNCSCVLTERGRGRFEGGGKDGVGSKTLQYRGGLNSFISSRGDIIQGDCRNNDKNLEKRGRGSHYKETDMSGERNPDIMTLPSPKVTARNERGEHKKTTS